MWLTRPEPNVAGLDLWQAHHFIVYRRETAAFLDGQYTPAKAEYPKGLFPTLEPIVARYTTAAQSDRAKAIALLTKGIAGHLLHPVAPPKGPPVATNRGMDDETLFASSCARCNEQARVYIRLCQIAGIPARMIYLFYSDGNSGHVVAEFFADGHWCMADSTWICVFPDDNGRLLSAAELHAPAAKPTVQRAYLARWTEILQHSNKPSDKQLAAGARRGSQGVAPYKADNLGSFGVLNYPLPPLPTAPPSARLPR